MIRKVRLGVEVLEGRELPATFGPPPARILLPPPPVPFVPAPIRGSLSAPIPVSAGADTSGTHSILAGTVLGDYTSTLRLLNTASGFHFSGSAKVGSLGNVDVYAHLYSVGFRSTGNAHGEITLSNNKGEIILSVTGPSQTRLSPLPDTFTYHVVSATGSFKDLKASGTLKLTRKADANSMRNGIQYVETGTFKLTL